MDVLINFAEKLGPTIVAILAIIVTFVIGKWQIQATTVSASRQRWIDSLRDDLAKLLTLQARLAPNQLRQRTRAEILSNVEEVAVLSNRIRLFLNRDDKKHTELWIAVMELQQVLYAGHAEDAADVTQRPLVEMDTEKLSEAYDNVFRVACEVIERERTAITPGR